MILKNVKIFQFWIAYIKNTILTSNKNIALSNLVNVYQNFVFIKKIYIGYLYLSAIILDNIIYDYKYIEEKLYFDWIIY